MDEPKFVEELQKMEYEPLLPVEKKLVLASLLVGFLLLLLMLLLSPGFI